MKTKRRIFMPLLLCLLLTGSLVYGAWVWYDSNIDRSGWTSENGSLYYRDFHGQLLSGWQEVEGGRYFFREDGSALTFWQELNGNRYYFGSGGCMARDWTVIDGNRHYFGDDGIQRTGWLELEGCTYYLPEGILATQWQTIGDKRYYFTENGAMALGFASIDGEKYYFGEDGVMVTGSQKLMGQCYYFREDGTMHFGWLETKKGRRYYAPDGSLALGWQVIGDHQYLFDKDGYPTTGWHQEGEYRYYFREDGTAAVGPLEIEGQTHYFTPKGQEVILVNANHPVPEGYDPELETVFAHHRAAKICHGALMDMLAGCEDAGISYEFNSAYRTVSAQTEILRSRTQIFMETYELPYAEARARALRTVALPGTSEHHLGLAVDLLGDEAQKWFQEHCWEYGFILRYLPGKERYTGIADEPWHFRYVGREIALELRDNGLSLEEYLGADPVKPWL